MFRNYLISALRSLKRQKLFAIINVTGLAIGLAACMLIILFVRHEFSYDQQFTDVQRLYRIEATANIPGQPPTESPNFFGPAYDLLPGDFEEIQRIVRFQQRSGTVVKDDGAISEAFSYVDPEFLLMFDFPLLEGTHIDALNSPASIALTEEMAIKHLGEGPWIDRTLVINEIFEREHKVTAVLENLPGNTHFDFDFLILNDNRVFLARASGGTTDLNRWNGLPFYVYVQLKEGRSIDNLVSSINHWVDKYFPSQIQALVGINGSELFTPRLVPVGDIHMYSPVQFDMKTSGSLMIIYSFSGIALLILTTACINFMNLAAAASTLRAREVALRKVMGARRKQLFLQFEIESILSAVIGLFFALLIIELVLPAFNNYTERQISTAAFLDPLVMLAIIGLTLLVALLAGIHPALAMSGFRPARILHNNKSSALSTSKLRSVLVLFQFTISATLIIMTLLIYIQTNYARSMDMGYDNENELAVRGLSVQRIGASAEIFRDVTSQIPAVSKVSLSSFTPGDARNVGLSLKVPGIDERVIIFYRSVYPAFFAQFDIKPIAGRLLDDQHANDRTIFISDPNSTEAQALNVVVNEAAAKSLGFSSPQQAIGQIYYRGRENQIVSTIVGVIPNIHFGSPRSDLDGEIFMYIPADVRNLIVSYDIGQYQVVRKEIEMKLQEMFPLVQMTIQHLQENIARQYREEEILGTLLAMFSGLALLIACMGLFGLASFTIAGRTKEIGVRKVMGASSNDIVLLMLAQFSRPVIVANVIAWPFCWYAFNEWLNGFNFRIDLLPWFCAVVGFALLATITLAWGTVASHVVRIARTSPIFALRYE